MMETVRIPRIRVILAQVGIQCSGIHTIQQAMDPRLREDDFIQRLLS
jgi:hypothetical protein